MPVNLAIFRTQASSCRPGKNSGAPFLPRLDGMDERESAVERGERQHPAARAPILITSLLVKRDLDFFIVRRIGCMLLWPADFRATRLPGAV